MRLDKTPLLLIGIGCFFGCESARPVVITDVTPRSAVRTGLIGCWSLRRAADNATIVPPDQAPTAAKFDTFPARIRHARGQHPVERLDQRGQRLSRDAEGFSFIDRWTADSASDSIRIVFNNGLYGSTWVLAFPARSGRVDTLRGQSQEFGDVVPAPAYPVRAVMATRIGCAPVSDSLSGI